jgi:hypothetical protein
MTALSVLQEAAPFIGLEVPTGVLSSTVREHVELKAVLNDMADTIAKSQSWQLLKRLATLTGDGTTEDFSLPSDYDWMPDTNDIYASDNDRPLCKVGNENIWLDHLEREFDPVPGEWIIYGGQLHIRKALGTGITARFFYQSNLMVAPATGANKATFTVDTDTFRLSERLLKLGVIFRWKQLKGLPYAEEMNDFENLKEKLAARDRGATMMSQGSGRIRRGVTVAYPGSVPGGT